MSLISFFKDRQKMFINERKIFIEDFMHSTQKYDCQSHIWTLGIIFILTVFTFIYLIFQSQTHNIQNA